MGFDAVTYAAAVGKSKGYTDDAISGLSGGLKYKGAVDYYSSLPNNAKIGDAYTVKYEGSSGTTPSGREYAWGKYDNVNQWIELGPDMSQYQPLLVNGTNIKSINNSSILGSGNLEIDTNQAYPASWSSATSGTTKAFCDVVNADSTANVGKTFLGEVTLTDMPFNGNAELYVEIMKGSGTTNKVIHLILTSGNVAPYRWEYTYWNNGTNVSGWVGFQTELVSGTNIKTINNTSILGSGNISTPDTASGFTQETWVFTLADSTQVSKKILTKATT